MWATWDYQGCSPAGELHGEPEARQLWQWLPGFLSCWFHGQIDRPELPWKKNWEEPKRKKSSSIPRSFGAEEHKKMKRRLWCRIQWPDLICRDVDHIQRRIRNQKKRKRKKVEIFRNLKFWYEMVFLELLLLFFVFSGFAISGVERKSMWKKEEEGGSSSSHSRARAGRNDQYALQ